MSEDELRWLATVALTRHRIDGSHDYGSVKQDIESFRPLLASGGLLSGHDYDHGGVRMAVTELLTRIKTPAGQIWAVQL